MDPLQRPGLSSGLSSGLSCHIDAIFTEHLTVLVTSAALAREDGGLAIAG
jgi:hypothetical protein